MSEINDNIKRERERHQRAANAIQAAIAFKMNQPGYRATDPKYMRVGIDTSRGEFEGLAALLIAKGIFSRLEYATAMADGMEKELELQSVGLPVDFMDRLRALRLS